MKIVLIILGVSFAAFLAYHFVCGFIEEWRKDDKPKLRVIWYEAAERSRK
jgi:uncharacterized membrane protein